jgi:ribosomal protein S18 acetylase RimI-like enzyme
MTVQIRSFTDKNLSSLVKLLNETRRESYEFVPFNEEKLRSRIGEWDLKILVAKEESEITGSVAYNSGHWGEEIEWLCVRESLNRKHLENLLVREIEKHVKGEKISTVVDAENQKINEWTERGYKPEGGLYHMVATLNTLKPLPKVPKGTIISSLKQKRKKISSKP